MSLSGHLRCMLPTKDDHNVFQFGGNWELPGKFCTLLFSIRKEVEIIDGKKCALGKGTALFVTHEDESI